MCKTLSVTDTDDATVRPRFSLVTVLLIDTGLDFVVIRACVYYTELDQSPLGHDNNQFNIYVSTSFFLKELNLSRLAIHKIHGFVSFLSCICVVTINSCIELSPLFANNH
jgi:hypothetical protein